MMQTMTLDRGREAFTRRKWRDACDALSVADGDLVLEPADLERFAASAYLIGDIGRANDIWTRLHHTLADQGDVERAARWGFWLSLHMLLAGDVAQATGWLARSQRLLKDREKTCAAEGYGLIVTGMLAMGKSDSASALADFEKAISLAEEFNDHDMLVLGLLGTGQCSIQFGGSSQGVDQLDAAMVSVSAGDVSPVLAGIVYCAVILTCQRIFDLHRAREWTRQLDHWCASQPDLVPYRGQCLVHRSEVLQMGGDWQGAFAEVKKARDHLGSGSEAVVARACYQQGELHRLCGSFAEADKMYQEAGRRGFEPQPGMSLLRLAEGKADAAAISMRGVADGAKGPARLRLLGPYVEILVAAGDLETARRAADELARAASSFDAPFLLAISTHATGTVLLAEGKMKAALALLREAWALWQQLEMPFEQARARTLIAQVCERLDDRETARMHVQAARSVFDQLGAAPNLAELDRLTATRDVSWPGGLTDREIQVLSLVAAGETNRQIAVSLGISEHTVARHLSNIFDKLGLSSRTAVGAFAHKHKLV
jgi:ATP/maltotriose-dependent transcriptional regulator MalT